jgi:hypothetical protein
MFIEAGCSSQEESSQSQAALTDASEKYSALRIWRPMVNGEYTPEVRELWQRLETANIPSERQKEVVLACAQTLAQLIKSLRAAKAEVYAYCGHTASDPN